MPKRAPVRMIPMPSIPLGYATASSARGADQRVLTRTILWTSAIALLATTLGAFVLTFGVRWHLPSATELPWVIVPLSQIILGPLALIGLGVTFMQRTRLSHLLDGWELLTINCCFLASLVPFGWLLSHAL